ncbi:fasciclin-like arabinogalactan protein 14 [Argentina anserina]|uniref:fasciclin-like arabinogalactan protein 14 n=1 Tax=Argentina anserina TaxID=57926 RepID=UPI0021768359|nr:fasciclin-like arabinogalactan protein 14 [Potentilla anserina]
MEDNRIKGSMFFVLLFMLCLSSTSAFNITNLLNKEPDFSTFNKYLSQTKLADQINKRSTITVLAVANDATGGLPSDDSFVLKSVMSVHIILDYFGREKLAKLPENNRSSTLTTLFQSSGVAQNQQGFVRVKIVDGEIYFGSAAKGAQMYTKLVKSVTAQPYNISVLEVSSIIGVPNINASPAPEIAPAAKKAKSPSPEDRADNPSEDTDDDTLDSDVDSDEEAEASSPSNAKDSTPPKPGYEDDLISADSPSSTPTPAPSKSDARSTAAEMEFGVVAMGLVSVSVAFDLLRIMGKN